MKGIIVAAGYGTRFFPVTKTVPKEMLPLVTRPAIDFIIEEFIASGITEILFISSRRKKCLEDYLDREIELEAVLKAAGKIEKCKEIAPPAAQFYFIRQQQMMGTGHALLLAKTFAGNDPCIVAYPDDIHMGTPPLALQLIEKYRETNCSVLATIYDPPDINRYGVLSLAADGLHVTGIVEKPPVGKEPSKEVTIGRFLYTPEFFSYLEEGFKQHTGGEYYHIYSLEKLAQKQKLVFKRITGKRLDTGEPTGYLEAILTYAATVPELNAVLKSYLSKG